MKIPNKNIKVRYWSGTYYTQDKNGKFSPAFFNAEFITKNCGSKSLNKRTTVSMPVKWSIPEVNKKILGRKQVHDWFTNAFIANTDFFVNKAKIEECNYGDDPGAKYPL